MKTTTMMMTAVATVVMATIGITSAPIASAYLTVGKLGSELTMVDTVGQVALSWTVSDLKPSADTIPDYPVAGKLWEATAQVKAIQGSRTPPFRSSTPAPPTAPTTGCCGRPTPQTASAEPPSPEAKNRPAESTSTSPAHRRPPWD